MRILIKYLTLVIVTIFPLLLWSQTEDVITLTDSSFSETGILVTPNSKYTFYMAGDDPDFAKPDYDDSNWDLYPNEVSVLLVNQKPILKQGEIVWFRTQIESKRSLENLTFIRIRQSGASEVYLDGKLMYKFGEIGETTEDMVFSGPLSKFYYLPLKPNQTHLLAIRYRHDPPTIPLLINYNGYFFIGLNSWENLTSEDMYKNPFQYNEQRIAFYNFVLGISVLMFIIFLSYFLFFPKERINGLFSISNFFLVLGVLGIKEFFQSGSGYAIYGIAISCTAIIISQLTLLYCIYKIFDILIDSLFKIVCGLAVLTIIGFIFYFPSILTPILGVIIYFALVVVSYRAYGRNKLASILFLSSGVLSLLFWLLFTLQYFTSLPISVIGYEGLVFMLNPVALAIYLGYAFGKRSQQLRSTLERVQKLSLEKENILSKQNELLEIKVKKRTESLDRSLKELKNTQSQLIHAEKMASLGELTAGIAHEIQNPLNFVNNFSEVSHELIDEMKEELEQGDVEEAKAISDDVKQNLEKITYHGKRADSIVKGMLQHSRNSAGEKEPTDLNKLTDEYMRLAYHGLRAKNKSFNATLDTQFDDQLKPQTIAAQDIGRVLLNLFTNAYFAVNEKEQNLKAAGKTDYQPTITASTSETASEVIITVKDNGNGIPEDSINRIFEPFYTTKPSGQGTGLGLSMSYDIIKNHGGEINVNTKTGEFTAFEIHLPKTNT